MSYLSGKSVLVTGGTGSFGKAFIRHALQHLEPERIAILSRDELKQYEFRSEIGDDPRLRWFIGDVRDPGRLARAFSGVDAIVHAAAMKQVDTAEYNPFECIATNVLGAENVINAAIDAGVERVVALSTDKASSPINLYGASKLCSDKLFVAGNHYAGHSPTRMSVVRYGNVMGSRGSVVPLFRRLAAEGRLPITDERMTRFWITLPQAVRFVVDSFDRMHGGEIFVPRIPSTTVMDLAAAIAPGVPTEVVGIRPGEKLHEEMISADDARRTFAHDDHYVIAPVIEGWRSGRERSGKPTPDGFAYRSDTNDMWISVEEIRDLLATV
ncbi:UDP-N-acetylglucosamine 4,6-dehydratase (inverting) [Rhabdothermincola salaria]|uniref:UDP-N-acetylglucosamine 4,6-dehydratase (inverting) n=1 Tax=Rhabdothermincola salaria TaxID=2903142 RepID=UPI001E5E7406|nr:UDP-N-acetylglucosamine 4,6-dehydratase (inverting) [Rhabdothermincola salaria]MCD9622768.1 UDP-N-acetylglucosamine 4,6-dehydratase (inverting) [Rhabdothermincola salaria]